MSAGGEPGPTSRLWDEAGGRDSAVSVTDPWARPSRRYGDNDSGAEPQPAASYPGYPGYPGYAGDWPSADYPGYPGYPGYPAASPSPPAGAYPAAGYPAAGYAAGTHPNAAHPTGAYPAWTHPTSTYPTGPGFPPPPGGPLPGGGQDSGWPYAPQRGPHRPKRWFLVVAILAAVALIAGAGALWIGPSARTTGIAGSPGSTAASGPTSSSVVPAGSSDAEIAAAVSPGLVDINTTLAYRDAQAAGTGMVLTSTGEVLTNNHVIEGATSITATDVGSGQTYKASVVGYDVSDDIAVLQLTGASGLKTVTLGDPSAVRVGQHVVGIGNAGGTGGTPSYAGGSVTALDQSITASDESGKTSEQLTGLIATDAQIVAGESGGPLVNNTGQVIGMDAAASSSFQFQRGSGGGYAIPVNKAVSVAQQAAAGAASDTLHVGPTAFLGVQVTDGGGSGGAQIASAVPNGPADQAGLSAGDNITSVDGHTITSPADLTRLMLTERPDASVAVEYLDSSGTQQSTTVQLGSGPPQ
ncbi:MAG: S1C family serine protease [Frankiaceae bacterium]